jgi:anthranilate/para-aminobenzoate synthase component II
MDILSFVLGIACVLVVAMAAVMVHLLLRVRKMSVELNDQRIVFSEDIHRLFQQSDRHSSIVDSRFDKCMDRIARIEKDKIVMGLADGV